MNLATERKALALELDRALPRWAVVYLHPVRPDKRSRHIKGSLTFTMAVPAVVESTDVMAVSVRCEVPIGARQAESYAQLDRFMALVEAALPARVLVVNDWQVRTTQDEQPAAFATCTLIAHPR